MSAVLSECGRYRYALWRDLPRESLLDEFHCPVMGTVHAVNDGSADSCWFTQDETCLFVMLNPSTADATEDDRTIGRCRSFARRWGLGRLAVANLYAYRATNPESLGEVEDPIGPDNDHWLCELANEASYIVAAWGANKMVDAGRIRDVFRMLDHDVPLVALELNRDGSPKHPLYVRSDVVPVDFHVSEVRG